MYNRINDVKRHSRMKIKPEELTENNYVLLDKLGHKELVSFIRTYFPPAAILKVVCHATAFTPRTNRSKELTILHKLCIKK